ncbi:Large exoprotein involved in heme utilization or adhesion [Yersinia enterocolitica]|uniref:two-partner secretion domain-containing protein n=1 Tax=Yersinia enterocolitica TaxID=630 RepID=UPI0005E0C66E|nr:filamentous hemagglutinin N-terminal domain-containing protein [Yersinia enterocolitica]CNL23534.1 Large exoprotein involved in heme utilization or adhesion [Yersinia enterocolitica]
MNFINGDTKKRLSLLPLTIIFPLCSISLSHAANIISDDTADKEKQADIRSDVLSLALCRSVMGCGETTIVNIQSPDKNGLSHNKYSKFDVPHVKDIVILNNEFSKKIGGNPNLVNSAAKIILNEVRSSQASRLAGKIQLSGRDAHVIIANPSGIDCHGCSFTAMSHLTLTTGKPYFNRHNKLQGFKILDGDININNGIAHQSGLNHLRRGEKSAYLNLFSNTLKVEGNITSDNIFIIAGKNKIKLASAGKKMGVTSLISYLSSPDYFKSVDVSNIGGIYANKIRIIAEGNIKNSNEIKSRGLIQMISRGNIKNRSGGHMTGESVQLYSINNKMKVFSYSEKIGKRPDSYTKNNDGTFSFVGKIKQSEI